MLTDHTLNKWAELLDERSFWEGPTTLERYELAELHSMARELIEARRAASTVIEQQAEIDRFLDAAWRAGRDAAAEAAGSYDPVAAMVGYELEPPSDLRTALGATK